MKQTNKQADTNTLNKTDPQSLTLGGGSARRDARNVSARTGANAVGVGKTNNGSNKQSGKNNPNKQNAARKNGSAPAQNGSQRQSKGNRNSAATAQKRQTAARGGANKLSVQSSAAAKPSPAANAHKASQPARDRQFVSHVKPRGKLKVMFLGGVGEIGKNMTVFEYGNSIVVLDAGMSFPGSDMPGVDVVIPDVSYIAEHRDKLRGILLTHGHEDHIGALPYIVEKLGGKIDVYGTRLTLALVENKLVERNVFDKVNLIPVSDKSVVALGDFTAEFIHVSHSVAGSVAICLRTPIGNVLHTGDFKIDYTPLGNDIMNLNRIAEIGKQGVLLLMSESTNVEKPGYTMSESVVEETINKVFQDAKGRRIIIATFASNVDRLGMIIELARKYRRKIAISGRSMNKYIETAARVGVLALDDDTFVDIDKIGNIEDGKLLILSTGSQGEPMSALTRMASGEFNRVQIGSNDTIVISATPIPGNERDVYNVINKLYRLGAVVVYSALQAVHVSGHACQEELKLIYTLAKPKFFIPVHGEYRHLKQHAMLVEKLNHKRHGIVIPEIGDCVELDANSIKVTGQVVSGSVMVDGLGVGDVGNAVLRDRLSLAEDGIVVCVLPVNKFTGKPAGNLYVESRGCVFAGDSATDNPIDEMKQLVRAELERLPSAGGYGIANIKAAIQRSARHYFRTKLKRNPVILPVIVEV